MTSADAVVIGGGVIGASVAYHLAGKGMRHVVVLERDRLGSGSTAKNAGGIRLQFSSEINVRLSLRSLPRFERFEDEFGVDIAFRQAGYLFLITETGDAAAFERSLALWERLEVPARRVERPEIAEIFPELVTEDVLFGTFCAKDGHADPHSILRGFVARGRERGVEFREGSPARGIEVSGGRVVAVRGGDERIETGVVIDAAGPWGAGVAKLAGVDLPIAPLRRHIFVTQRVPGFDREIPLTIEFATGLYMHRESGGVLLGMGDPKDGPGFDDSVNWDFLPEIVGRALARLPILERTSVRTGWAGFYEDTPDKHPVLGPAGPDGFYAAAGFSGHGVMHAPAAGELLAELVCDGRASLDLRPFRASRFAEGDVVPEHNVI
ncbi:MAG TPA: FAD-dependent oxidoreductase [Candidatus Limnocylindria bacterium]|nr:FAD-dependent oxidoreductase [Candidatus Limnocylindria bacterium]